MPPRHPNQLPVHGSPVRWPATLGVRIPTTALVFTCTYRPAKWTRFSSPGLLPLETAFPDGKGAERSLPIIALRTARAHTVICTLFSSARMGVVEGGVMHLFILRLCRPI